MARMDSVASGGIGILQFEGERSEVPALLFIPEISEAMGQAVADVRLFGGHFMRLEEVFDRLLQLAALAKHHPDVFRDLRVFRGERLDQFEDLDGRLVFTGRVEIEPEEFSLQDGFLALVTHETIDLRDLESNRGGVVTLQVCLVSVILLVEGMRTHR